MRNRAMCVALAAFLALGATTYGGDGYPMKCQSKPCGYETYVTFGGGMLASQITTYCRSCKKFVYLTWTRENLPAQLKGTVKSRPRPKPLGEVWDSRTGAVLTVHACRTCKGPVLEIKSLADLKCCPKCSKPGFAVDKSKPRMAID